MVDFVAVDTPERAAWRQEIREFLKEELPSDYLWSFDTNEDDAAWDVASHFWQKVGAKGWVGLTWPREYYGLGRDAIDKWILEDELNSAGAPGYPVVGLGVADAVMRLGTPAQRLRHLKGIAEATTWWGEGFTEPDSGSDLASLGTRAERDGDEWVLNGEKTFGTAMHRCQWMYALARTDPNVPKHAGLTCFLVKVDTPGITISPMHNIAGGRQNHTYFNNVRIPLDSVVGDVNRAWQQVWFRMGGEQLDKAGPAPTSFQRKLSLVLDELIRYCKETIRGGAPIAADPIVRAQLADLMIGVEGLRVMEFDNFSRFQSRRPSPVGEAAGHLVDGIYKEFWPHFAQVCMEIAGPMSQVQEGPLAPMLGALDRFYRGSFGNHGGGTSQLKRMVVANRGLGLPR